RACLNPPPTPPPPLVLLRCAGRAFNVCVSSGLCRSRSVIKCPLHIDCAKEGRHFCRPGSSRCGPCLSPLEENKEGRCVVRKRHHQHAKEPELRSEERIQTWLKLLAAASEREANTRHTLQITPQELRQKMGPFVLIRFTVWGWRKAPAVSGPPNTPAPRPGAPGVLGRIGPIAVPTSKSDNIIVVVISLCVVVGTAAVILATVCYVKLQRNSRLAQKVDYPAFKGAGVAATAANAPSVGDNTLAQSAQMYHYQHQKQQMLSMGNNKPEQKVLDSEVTSDEEEVGGDFTVYECPGLAPTGEMEVKNPLFDDSTLHYQGNS
uniref:Neural proliferation, differentiation and control, 1a n=1 Tax=Gasterosteus aculeatus TaxID=69293 RepID=G3PZT2_GASAC